jgi:hypothetical protein
MVGGYIGEGEVVEEECRLECEEGNHRGKQYDGGRSPQIRSGREGADPKQDGGGEYGGKAEFTGQAGHG